MGFIAAGHQRATKVENTKWWWWWSFISSLLILPFQVECTYVLLSSIRVNLAFMWHAIIVPQSASLIISATQWSSSNTKPRDLLSCNMVKHLLTTGISAPPYLGISKPRKTPNLNRFYKRKRKNWAYSIKNWNDMFGNWSISTRDLLSSKNYDLQTKYTLFHFL